MGAETDGRDRRILLAGSTQGNGDTDRLRDKHYTHKRPQPVTEQQNPATPPSRARCGWWVQGGGGIAGGAKESDEESFNLKKALQGSREPGIQPNPTRRTWGVGEVRSHPGSTFVELISREWLDAQTS